MSDVIFHIDVNSAYFSWTSAHMLESGETLDLRAIPSIIGGDEKSRRGIVLAKSVPAKAFGIVTGEPVAAALKNARCSRSLRQTTRSTLSTAGV